MRKPAFCMCENKGEDQLCGIIAADQPLCFCYIVQSLYFLNFKHLAIFYGCTAQFALDLVRNPEDRSPNNAAQL